MRFAFVHGINNQNNTPQSIERDWWRAIESGWAAAGLAAKPKPPIVAAYYADILSGRTSSPAVEMGAGAESTGFAVGLLREYADAAGITQEELQRAAADLGIPAEAVEQGVPHEGWIIDFAATLESVLPTRGKWVAKLFLRQAVTYINDKALAARIDRTVAKQIFAAEAGPDPVVVVAHSLGTVVSYRVLASASAAGRDVPLFMTLGSPLSVRMFKPILPVRGSIPHPPIAQWFNGRHPEDFVTLGRAITSDSIGFPGVTDSTAIDNDESDKHSIVRYLASPNIAQQIHALL